MIYASFASADAADDKGLSHQTILQELAHTHKYPDRDPDAWKFKLVKYKPGDSVDGFDIALGPLVSYACCVA